MNHFIETDFKKSTQNDYAYSSEIFEKSERWKITKALYSNFIQQKKEEAKERIPKIIHQIWLGSKFPKLYKTWQNSWKKYHPNWEYRLWTDSDIIPLKDELGEVFFKTKNFGPKSDILRYTLLKKYGGLYVDTDFECLKSFEPFHLYSDFYTGIMNGGEVYLCTALIGSCQEHPIVNHALESINQPILTHNADAIMDLTGPGAFTKSFFKAYNASEHINVAFPLTYFYPFPNNKLHIKSEKKIKKLYQKEESYGIHYWEVSWKNTSYIKKISSKILRLIPSDLKNKIKKALGKT